MQKVIEYKLESSSSIHTLQAKVNDAMNEGWVPSGAVVSHNARLIQAMVKFEELKGGVVI